MTKMNTKEKKVKEKNDLSLNVNNPVTPTDSYSDTSSSKTTTPCDAAAATTPSTAVTPTDAYIVTPSDIAAAAPGAICYYRGKICCYCNCSCC